MYSKDIYLHNIKLNFNCNNYKIFKDFCEQLNFPRFRQYKKYIKVKINLSLVAAISTDERADIFNTEAKNFNLNCWIKNISLKLERKTNTINAQLIYPTHLSIDNLLHLIVIAPLRRILQKYNIFLLHAGVVSKNDKTILLFAGPGRGKSTLTTSFLLAGYDVLSDEFAIYKDKKVFSFPIKIKLDRKTLLCLKWNRTLRPCFYVKDFSSSQVIEFSKPLLSLFLRQATESLRIPRFSMLDPLDAFRFLARDKVNSLTYEKDPLLRRRQLDALANIAQKTRCYTIIYNLKHIKQIPKIVQEII
ncbi:MAG: hypothetical protein AB1472_00350 [Candidatus Omnitrophota bacterium]